MYMLKLESLLLRNVVFLISQENETYSDRNYHQPKGVHMIRRNLALAKLHWLLTAIGASILNPSHR